MKFSLAAGLTALVAVLFTVGIWRGYQVLVKHMALARHLSAHLPAAVKPESPPPPAAAVVQPSPAVQTAPAIPKPASPLAGISWFVDPDSEAIQQANAWRSSRPADAALMTKLASQPTGRWLGDWNPNARADTAQFVDQAQAAGKTLLLVIYNLPQRDCGEYSAGGAASAAAYQAWIEGVAQGIGNRRSVVVLEPDGLAGLDCLSVSDQAMRYQMIAAAIARLKRNPSTTVYVDAGNARWHPPGDMVARLKRAGITQADGFALNVSNFLTTAESLSYGQAISAGLGGKHFVIDVSRNGLGPTPDLNWCNPPGRALGNPPTTVTASPVADAYLWIKLPGESDGDCGGGPSAGEWWPEYALGLVQRARW